MPRYYTGIADSERCAVTRTDATIQPTKRPISVHLVDVFEVKTARSLAHGPTRTVSVLLAEKTVRCDG